MADACYRYLDFAIFLELKSNSADSLILTSEYEARDVRARLIAESLREIREKIERARELFDGIARDLERLD